ncbi:Cytochrome b5-like Heme/Steroid binding domain protein [Candidatus Gugararchaeum adminiculabundum]|nr:Cytochrome b5-like Heme/Steroid binding domain protein [Candidatus Gugararchaeum adminiculabundum]
MNWRIIALLAIPILLLGCTINPQDSLVKTQGQQAPVIASDNGNAPVKNSTITLTLEEVARHSTANDCWMVIHNKVLDLSSYTSHPGGSGYTAYCGTDATVAFDTKGGRGNQHSGNAVSQLDYYTIGQLNQTITIGVGQ